jgi:hypothetical protein
MTALVPGASLPSLNPTTLVELFQLAKVLAESGYFASSRQPAQALVKILAGRELGFPMIASLTGIHIIEGRPSVGSHLLAAAIRSSGRYDYEITEHTDQVCAIRFKRLIGQEWVNLEPVERITLAEAREKGWTRNKSTWEKTPKNMLFARCITNGQKFHCPDLFSGLLVYDADELEPAEPRAIVDASYTVNGSKRQGDTETGSEDKETGRQGDTETRRQGESGPPPVSLSPGLPVSLSEAQRPGPTQPAPDAPEAGLTEEQYQALVKLAREHKRSQGEIRALCAALGVPTFNRERLPPERLAWIREALTWGLVPTVTVDRITALVEAMGLDWIKFNGRLQERYQVTSLAHLLPSQAQEILASLEAKQARVATPAGSAA